jgi:hypothetical protein
MSNSNTFNGELAQTPLNSAYNFTSFSQYIINGGLYSKFSPVCIFCSSNNTIALTQDGSFRQCNNCKKQFKSNLNGNNSMNGFYGSPPFRTTN